MQTGCLKTAASRAADARPQTPLQPFKPSRFISTFYFNKDQFDDGQ